MGESRAGRAGLTPVDPETTPDRSAPDRSAPDWSTLHHGIDPASVPFVRSYLRVVTAAAQPLRAVPPTAITIAGVASALAATRTARPAGAFALVLLATACDAVDGAVAVAAGRASRSGAVADKTADRIADSCFAVVTARCGAPRPLAAVAGGLSLGLEVLREVRGGAARSQITVAERPTRVICTLLACASATVTTRRWPAAVCAGVWTVLGAAGLAQLASTRRAAP